MSNTFAVMIHDTVDTTNKKAVVAKQEDLIQLMRMANIKYIPTYITEKFKSSKAENSKPGQMSFIFIGLDTQEWLSKRTPNILPEKFGKVRLYLSLRP
jgi:hypothetical protein